MANRTMQAKVLKLKKQRRLFPKSYSASYIPVGKQPNAIVLSEYSMRGRSTYDAYLEKIFPGVIPKDSQSRQRVLLQLEKTLKDVPLERHIILEDSEEQKVMMFFNVKHTSFFLVWIDKQEQVRRTSIKYSSKSRLLSVLSNQSVTWIEKVNLST